MIQNPSNDPFYRMLDSQMLATGGFILVGVLNLYILWEQKEKYKGTHPCKDYSYLDTLAQVSVLLLLGASIYFSYFSYLESGYKKTGPYYWALFANLLFLAGSIIKTNVVFTGRPEAEIVAAEE